MAHKIVLKLHFSQEYVFIVAEKIIQKLVMHTIEKSKQITGTLH